MVSVLFKAGCLATVVLCVVLAPTSCQAGKPAIVLVHGTSSGGYFYEYPQPELGAPTGVKGLLEKAGYAVYNPTLPYHAGPADAYNKSDGPMTADNYAQSLASVFIDNDLHDATVVCHSAGGGGWCQILYAVVPDRIARFVHIDAFVVLPGDSLLSTLPALSLYDPVTISAAIDPLAFFFPFNEAQVFTIYEWKEHLIQTRKNDTAFVQRTYEYLVPEPVEPLTEKLNVTAFVTAPLPKAMVYLTEDLVFGFKEPDRTAFLFFADRLKALPNGGVPFKMFNLTSDHLCYLTQPVETAQVVLEAVEYLRGMA